MSAEEANRKDEAEGAGAAHLFFEELRKEALRPHCGEHFKQYTRALLLRAQEAGLYLPPTEQS